MTIYLGGLLQDKCSIVQLGVRMYILFYCASCSVNDLSQCWTSNKSQNPSPGTQGVVILTFIPVRHDPSNCDTLGIELSYVWKLCGPIILDDSVSTSKCCSFVVHFINLEENVVIIIFVPFLISSYDASNSKCNI